MKKVRPLTGYLGGLVAVVCVLAAALALDNVRAFGAPLLSGLITVETHYYYALMALLLPPAFLLYRSNPRFDLIGLDLLLGLLAFGICVWLYLNAETMLDEGWEFGAPDLGNSLSIILWVLVLEAVRRIAGTSLFILVLLFSLYPLVADLMPEALQGMATSLADTAAYHVMSSESLVGLPFRAFASLVIGFLVFGVALQHTGGGDFFIKLAFAMLGRVRGGPAKVAIVASGLMGSLSGSVITNVLTTGQLTIPAMKKSGIDKETAAAIEACASTGGVLLPPIMGSPAFVMATFLEMPYYQVALAAAIPALLYFTALFLQIDAYAAKHKLEGVVDLEIPRVGETLKAGWYYLGAFMVLIFLLLVMQREALAPWLATACLIVLNQFSKQHRWQLTEALAFLRASGVLLIELLVILSGVGLIVGALSMTGLSGTLVNELLFLAGGSLAVLLLMGAATSFVLGIGMTVTAAYIFLAIILAPALIKGGLDPLAVHLFILYWGMLSFITPPVALGAFAAASIAGARPMLTGLRAMGLGASTYFIPFFFVLEPALILQGTWQVTVIQVIQVMLGITLIAGAMQGYLLALGPLSENWLVRLMLGLSGLLIALPGLGSVGIHLDDSSLGLTGFLLACVSITGSEILVRRRGLAVD
ncbi:TRAP transporter fused permease subunit [Pseudomonadales bacterium]|nr:TRAP transporter fused permease subunit [Pseudomonadales bacterium]